MIELRVLLFSFHVVHGPSSTVSLRRQLVPSPSDCRARFRDRSARSLRPPAVK